MPPRCKRVAAVDGKQFGDQTPDQMELISCRKKNNHEEMSNYLGVIVFKYFEANWMSKATSMKFISVQE